MDKLKLLLPGIFATFLMALVATSLGKLAPVIGGPVFGILIGIVINNMLQKPASFEKGVQFVSKKILQWAIVVLGAGLSFSQVSATGIESLAVTLVTIAVAFLAAYGFGKIMNIDQNLKTLIGVGTAICGGSAIAAVSPIIEADETEIAYAVSTIFLFNILAVLVFPPLGHLMGFTDKAFGLWAGTAINDTSSVVAAGYAYSTVAGDYATIVKLTRATLIIPIALVYTAIVAFKKKKQAVGDKGVHFELSKIFPWFILWFLVASMLNTLGVFKGDSIPVIQTIGKFMITMALSAVGLSCDFKKMLKSGFKPILLGLIVWFCVAAASVMVQTLTGQV